MSRWEKWIHEVLSEGNDDVFVALLRQRIESGERIVRLSIPSDEFDVLPTYELVLSRGADLNVVRVPHTQAFVRFCLSQRLRMETLKQESWRFGAVLASSFVSFRNDWGEDAFQEAVGEFLAGIAPPESRAVLSSLAATSRTETKARFVLHRELGSLARDLKEELGYSEADVGAILDRALLRSLEQYVSMTETDGPQNS